MNLNSEKYVEKLQMQNKDYTKLSFFFVIIDSHLIYKI